MFLAIGVVTRCLASHPPGPRGSSSPASLVLSRHCDFLPPFPPRFVSFAWRYHGNAQLSLPPSPRVATSGLGLVTRWPRPGFLPWKRQDLPSSWGTPIPVCPCSPTPAGRCVPNRDGTLAWPPLRERRRRRRRESFEAQWHGFRADGLRIAMLVTRHRARLASGRWSGVSGQAFTRRAPTKGFQLTSCALASFSKLLGTIPGIPRTAGPCFNFIPMAEKSPLASTIFRDSARPKWRSLFPS